MSTTSITFRGLCTFIQHQQHYDVCLLAGAGPLSGDHHDQGAHPRHLPSLSVNIKFVDTDPTETTWLPDAVVYDKTGGPEAQIGVWKLDRYVLTLKPSVGGSGQPPKFMNRDKEADLTYHHQTGTAKARTRADIMAGGAAIVELVDGAIVSREPTADEELHLIRGNDPTRIVSKGPFARAFEWSLDRANLTVKIVSSAGVIALKEKAQVSITNVAPVMASKGLMHFEHYYETFVQKPAEDQQLQLVFNVQDEPVYDCVPPSPGPTP
jgi:hypothetical protein